MDGGQVQELMARLPHGTVSSHPGEVAAHAHDRWALALLREARGDRVAPPAAVVFATTTEQVAITLAWAQEAGVPVVPRGGGTGLAGGAEAVKHSVVIDTSHMDRILAVDEISQVARAEAGVRVAALDRALRPHGLITGFDADRPEDATMGGYVAGNRGGGVWLGSGSPRGRVLGVTAVLPGGEIVTARPAPESSHGFDLRDLLAGSEGILGVVTEATIGLVPLPRDMAWETFRPHAFDAGLTLVREVVQRGYRPQIIGLLDESDASAMFGSPSRPAPVIIVGFDREAPAVDAARFELQRLARDLGARQAEREMAVHWWEHRMDGAMWHDDAMGASRALGSGVVVDRLEVAALWRHLPRVYEEVRGVLLDEAEIVRGRLAGTSPYGATLAFAFVVRGSDDHQAGLRYVELWERASRACLNAGGAPSGERGLRGTTLVPDELGSSGLMVTERLRTAFDPTGVMNPGKLL
jgi:alkyldihydroxyacetonephosphate synthase